MKNLKQRRLFLLGIMLVAVLFAGSSCSKDDEVSESAEYVGTWQASTDLEGIEAKETLILTSNTFNIKYQIKDPTSGAWVDYIAMKGSIAVNNKIITGTIKEIGIAFDFLTGEPTATMTTYAEGSSMFNLIISESVGGATFTSEYSVSGNTLTLKTDDNGDGDYLDEGESEMFTKQ
jgi:hypothetical protein